jgi:monoamine oxidase
MNTTNVIVIGAGAAGLMTAYTLTKAGNTVKILEARNRIGGRMHTTNDDGFSAPTELGAEFVHGNLPVTLGLLKEAGIGTTHVNFEMWQYNNGAFTQSAEFVERWDDFLEAVNKLQHDMPLYDFLQQNFSGEEYTTMRAQVENYVAGYDTADIHDVSTFALRDEWNYEDEDAQHRIDGGYVTLANYLAGICHSSGAEILLNTVVDEVVWKENFVTVKTTDGSVYEANKVIVALPLGVLQLPENAEGRIAFNPPLQEQTNAVNEMGFGSIIKILLEFDDAFWESEAVCKRLDANLSTMGFLFTYGQHIPTFWTQSPLKSPLITGWLGGPPAFDKKDASNEEILDLAIESLSDAFAISAEVLKAKLVAWNVTNWTAETFTRGSYAYDTVKSPDARKLLQQPVADTIYFAGEYLYEGPSMGTVEAALTSGKNVAKLIIGKQ